MVTSAVLSADGVYRYRLERRWGTGGVRATFVMLNPSTADATVDDPTIRRCIGFARREVCDELVVVNLFALRATDPTALVQHPDPVGPDNWHHLREAVDADDRLLIAAWGASYPRALVNHVGQVRRLLAGRAHCLGRTASGEPRHPLYVRGNAELVAL